MAAASTRKGLQTSDTIGENRAWENNLQGLDLHTLFTQPAKELLLLATLIQPLSRLIY